MKRDGLAKAIKEGKRAQRSGTVAFDRWLDYGNPKLVLAWLEELRDLRGAMDELRAAMPERVAEKEPTERRQA